MGYFAMVFSIICIRHAYNTLPAMHGIPQTAHFARFYHIALRPAYDINLEDMKKKKIRESSFYA